MRIHRALTGAITVATLVLAAACGSSGTDGRAAAPSTTGEQTASVTLERVDDPIVITTSCDAYQDFSATSAPLVQALVRAGQLREAGDLVGSRDLYVATVQQYAGLSDAAVLAVARVGDPASDPGAVWIDSLQTQLTAADAVIDEVLAGAARLDTSSPEAFKAGVDGLAAEFATFAGSLDDPRGTILEVPGGSEFVAGLSANPSCAELLDRF